MSENYKEKLHLLAEMVSFSVIDGALHPKEYQFLQLVACELQIKAIDFDDLFHADLTSSSIKNPLERIQQFYRLALLMHCDGVLHEKETKTIHELGIKMALNPFAIDRILKKMKHSPTNTIEPQFLIEVFEEQQN